MTAPISADTVPDLQLPPTPPAPTPAVMPPRQPERQDPPADGPQDVASLPEWAQKQIKDLRAEAARQRTDPRRAAEQARSEVISQVAELLGLADEDPTPEDLAQRLEQARDGQWRSSVELAVYRHASRHGADADRLLDSVAFLQSLDDIDEDLDPSGRDFADAIGERITAALEKHGDKYKAAGQAPAAAASGQAPAPKPDPSQGARGTPVARRPGSLHEAIAASLVTRT